MSRTNHNYWKTREYIQTEELYKKTIAEIERRLAKQYKSTSRRLLNELEALYDKILAENDTVLVSTLYRYDKFYEVLTDINRELTRLGIIEQQILEDKLSDMYLHNSSIIGKDLLFNIKPSQEQIDRAINTIWTKDGLNFSNRIWRDKAQLVETLQQGLFDCVTTGMSSAELKKELMSRFNVSYRNADRLARTELAHVQVSSTIDTYKNAGVKQYEILAELDERTCDVCEELDGKRFPIDDTEHMPPMHPFVGALSLQCWMTSNDGNYFFLIIYGRIS